MIGTGVVLAMAALLHPTFGAHKLYGLYEPGPGIAERHLAPLLNPNNLAGYLNVALCLALAATFSPVPSVPRPIAAAVVLFLGSTQIWVASRGGVVSMVLGALIVLAIARMARMQRGQAVATLSAVTGMAAAVGVILIVLGGSDDASSELFESDVSKLTTVVREMRMIRAVPFFGCGRGAFESAFPPFRFDVGHVTYAYPENVIAQWTLEWGLPVGLAGLAALAFALRPRAVLARSTTAAGAWAAVVAVAIQNMGDLGSEIPGLALAGVACAAIVVAGPPGEQARWRVERWGRVPRLVAIGPVLVAAIGIVLAAIGVRGELHADQHAMREAALDRHASLDEMDELVRAGMLRHPGSRISRSSWRSALRRPRTTIRFPGSGRPWSAQTCMAPRTLCSRVRSHSGRHRKPGSSTDWRSSNGLSSWVPCSPRPHPWFMGFVMRWIWFRKERSPCEPSSY